MDSAQKPSLNNAITMTNKRLTNLQTQITKVDQEIGELMTKAIESKKAGHIDTAKMYLRSKLMKDKTKQQLLQFIEQTTAMRNKLQTAKSLKSSSVVSAKGGRSTRKVKRSKRRFTRRR